MSLVIECPRCRATEFVEWASRPTSQVVELQVADVGVLEFGNYHEFEWGDGTENETIVCAACEYVWSSLAPLEVHMRAMQALDALRESDMPNVASRRAIALLEPIDHRES